MLDLKGIGRNAKCQRLGSLTLAGLFPFFPIAPAFAAMSNTVTATGYYNGIAFTAQDTISVDLADADPVLTVDKSAVLNDNDGTPGLSAGDRIDYTITVGNAGNVSIIDVVLTDTMELDPRTLTLDADPVLDSGDDVDPGVLNVGETWTYLASYTITQADIEAGGTITNTADVTARTIAGRTTAGRLTGSALAEIGVGPSTALSIQKSAAQNVVRLGDTISYTITLTNTQRNPYVGAYVVDTLPAGLSYTPNSAVVGGIATEPTINGRILEFGPLTIPGSGTFDITLSARLGQQVSGSELTNIAQGVDANGNTLTNLAKATVRIVSDPVFSCSTIIGKVFDDKNRNGVQDAQTSPYTPEPGLPGVRLVTVEGLIITTDEYGRYSVPCASLPDVDIGSNFILKLDTRTLPTGYRVTTENPRVVRMTAGKMTTMNFGASISRVIEIELSGTAFTSGSATPTEPLENGIDQLVTTLETEPSVLRMTYKDQGEGTDLARKRIAAVEKLIQKKLRRSQIGTDLWIESKIITR